MTPGDRIIYTEPGNATCGLPSFRYTGTLLALDGDVAEVECMTPIATKFTRTVPVSTIAPYRFYLPTAHELG